MPLKIALVQTADRLINQLQQNIKQALEPFFATPSGTFQAALTGCTVSVAATLNWAQGVLGGPVTISVLAPLFGTSNTAAATVTGLPKGLWPSQLQYVQVPVTDAGTTIMATATVGTNGVITLYKSLIGAAFTASGSKGLYACSFTYALGA